MKEGILMKLVRVNQQQVDIKVMTFTRPLVLWFKGQGHRRHVP